MEANCTNHLYFDEIGLAKAHLVVFHGASDRKPMLRLLHTRSVDVVPLKKDSFGNDLADRLFLDGPKATFAQAPPLTIVDLTGQLKNRSWLMHQRAPQRRSVLNAHGTPGWPMLRPWRLSHRLDDSVVDDNCTESENAGEVSRCDCAGHRGEALLRGSTCRTMRWWTVFSAPEKGVRVRRWIAC
jgi:hypothetical protein